MECASHACALLKHGFSNPNILPGRQIYAWMKAFPVDLIEEFL
jgi:hypothetical protein